MTVTIIARISLVTSWTGLWGDLPDDGVWVSWSEVSIRLQRHFCTLFECGRWADVRYPLFTGLAFITNADNVNLKTKVMTNVPKEARRHLSSATTGTVGHYPNSRRQVVRQQPSAFSRSHYAAPDNAMFWGRVL